MAEMKMMLDICYRKYSQEILRVPQDDIDTSSYLSNSLLSTFSHSDLSIFYAYSDHFYTEFFLYNRLYCNIHTHGT